MKLVSTKGCDGWWRNGEEKQYKETQMMKVRRHGSWLSAPHFMTILVSMELVSCEINVASRAFVAIVMSPTAPTPSSIIRDREVQRDGTALLCLQY